MARGSQLTENIRKVRDEIEKLGGSVQSNKLIKHMEKLPPPNNLSHQTTRNALNEGVILKVIQKVERDEGKQKFVFYSTNTEWVKNEQSFLEDLENLFQWYDEKFGKLKKVFPDLPVYYKAEGLYTLGFFMNIFSQDVVAVRDLYGGIKNWEDIQNKFISRTTEVKKLVESISDEKELANTIIQLTTFIGGEVSGAIEDVEEYFVDLKKLPNLRTNSTKNESKKGPL